MEIHWGNAAAADILELVLAQTRTYIHMCIRVGIRTQLRLLFCAIEHNVLEFNLTADRTTNAGQEAGREKVVRNSD